MRSLTSEQKVKIHSLAEGLHGDSDRLLSEVSKWEEQGNEIIVIAKRMCMIMMDLSDFTRYIYFVIVMLLSYQYYIYIDVGVIYVADVAVTPLSLLHWPLLMSLMWLFLLLLLLLQQLLLLLLQQLLLLLLLLL